VVPGGLPIRLWPKRREGFSGPWRQRPQRFAVGKRKGEQREIRTWCSIPVPRVLWIRENPSKKAVPGPKPNRRRCLAKGHWAGPREGRGSAEEACWLVGWRKPCLRGGGPLPREDGRSCPTVIFLEFPEAGRRRPGIWGAIPEAVVTSEGIRSKKTFQRDQIAAGPRSQPAKIGPGGDSCTPSFVKPWAYEETGKEKTGCGKNFSNSVLHPPGSETPGNQAKPQDK